MGIMFAFSYLWLIGLVIAGVVSPWILLAFLSLPKAIKATTGFIGKTEPITMMPAMKNTAQTNTFFGLLMAIGLFISYYNITLIKTAAMLPHCGCFTYLLFRPLRRYEYSKYHQHILESFDHLKNSQI